MNAARLVVTCVVAAALLPGELRAQVSIKPTGFVTAPRSRETAADLARVVGVLRDSHGNVLVLDQRRRQILVFNGSGRFLFATSELDSGPLRVPVSLKAQSASSFVLWDGGAKRGFAFRTTLNSLVVERRWKGSVDASDACSIGDDLFLFGLDSTGILHAVRDSAVVRAFGEPFGPSNPQAQRRLSRGPITCDQRSSRIFVAGEQVPRVRAYTTRGRLLWQAQISGFAEVQVSPAPDGSMVYRAAPEGSDVTITLATIGPDMLLLQTGRLTDDSKSITDFQSISTRILDARTGVELTTQRDLPQLIGIRGYQGFTLEGGDQPALRSVEIRVVVPRK